MDELADVPGEVVVAERRIKKNDATLFSRDKHASHISSPPQVYVIQIPSQKNGRIQPFCRKEMK